MGKCVLVFTGTGFWQFHNQMEAADKYKVQFSIISTLVASHDCTNTAESRYNIDSVPLRLDNKCHFIGINNNKTKSGTQAFPDCVVCTD